jgi:hypothetical protein
MKKDSVQLLLELLKDKLASRGFKEFYDTDPDEIPTANLPCVVVEQLSDVMTRASVAENDITDTLVIKVVMNKRDFERPDQNPENRTGRKLREIFNGRDATTGRYLPTTVRGAVERVKLDGDRRISRDQALEFGVALRPNNMATYEGHLTIQILHSVYYD